MLHHTEISDLRVPTTLPARWILVNDDASYSDMNVMRRQPNLVRFSNSFPPDEFTAKRMFALQRLSLPTFVGIADIRFSWMAGKRGGWQPRFLPR
jgi:hypothetical protein